MMRQYFQNISKISQLLYEKEKHNLRALEKTLFEIQRYGGRLYIIGVGGSAANASHATSDFRKLCGIETYCFENLAEITARTNDEGFETIFEGWLKGNDLGKNDVVMIFSVGGGNAEKNVSVNLIKAIDYAKGVGAKIIGIVGRDGGYTKKMADVCVLIPTVNEYLVTPFAESFQAIIWHMLAFHPSLNVNAGKWEEIALKK